MSESIYSNSHDRKKAKRRIRIHKQNQFVRRRVQQIESSGGWKPSIYVHHKWDPELGDFVSTGRIKRGKNSKTQKFLKKQSNRRNRRLSHVASVSKGNHYRKNFDYWWEWI